MISYLYYYDCSCIIKLGRLITYLDVIRICHVIRPPLI